MSAYLVHVDCLERYRFFRRLQQALPEHRWQLITGRLSLLQLARRDGMSCHWLQRGAATMDDTLQSGIETGLEAALNWRGPRHWLALQRAVWFALTQYCDPHTTLLIWNGCRTIEQTMTAFARHHRLPVLYLELGNFPGKLFADPEGVNARSRLARQPQLLDALADPVDQFESWRSAYLQRHQQPPQSAQVKQVNPQWWRDQLGYWLGGLSADQPLWQRAWRKWRARRQPLTASATPPDTPFLLYPMQVSSDSQLCFNSDIDNRQAIAIAAEQARDAGLALCIKPHPAEPDATVLQWLQQQSAAQGWHLCRAPMTQLLPQASQVVTINSTVGLEAMLLDKPLRVLGRSHYADFTPRRLRQYLMSYLHPIDYFNDSAIEPADAERLLARAEVAR